jgi:hypothetical protein
VQLDGRNIFVFDIRGSNEAAWNTSFLVLEAEEASRGPHAVLHEAGSVGEALDEADQVAHLVLFVEHLHLAHTQGFFASCESGVSVLSHILRNDKSVSRSDKSILGSSQTTRQLCGVDGHLTLHRPGTCELGLEATFVGDDRVNGTLANTQHFLTRVFSLHSSLSVNRGQ